MRPAAPSETAERGAAAPRVGCALGCRNPGNGERTTISVAEAFAAFARLRLRTEQVTCKLVWLLVGPQLDHHRPRPVSIRRVAQVLDVKTRTVRRALDSLVTLGLLERESPTRGHLPGWYQLGAQAIANEGPTGACGKLTFGAVFPAADETSWDP